MIKPTVPANILLETEPPTRDSGLKTRDVVRENSNGQMGLGSKDCTRIIRKMGKENLSGRMGITMRGTSKTIESLGKGK